jgi:uncharacterized short protein YbdD (DUF466 family)
VVIGLSEFSVRRQGMNQESQHKKHNDPGQPGRSYAEFWVTRLIRRRGEPAFQ